MAIAISAPIAVYKSSVDQDVHTMGAFTPAANASLWLCVRAHGSTSRLAISGGGLTWNYLGAAPDNQNSGHYTSLFWARTGGSPASCEIEIDASDDQPTGVIAGVIEVTGGDQVTARPWRQIGSVIPTSTNQEVVLNLAPLAASAVIGFASVARSTAATAPAGPPAWTTYSSDGFAEGAPGTNGNLMLCGITGSALQTSTFGASAAGNGQIFIIEIYISGAGPANQTETTLYFSGNSYPIDPVTYAPVTPAFIAADITTAAVRRCLLDATNEVEEFVVTPEIAWAGPNESVLVAQFFQRIRAVDLNGARATCQIQAREVGAGDNIHVWSAIRVLTPALAVRGTALAWGDHSRPVSNKTYLGELRTSTNCGNMPAMTDEALGNVQAQDGDYLEVSLGFKDSTGTTMEGYMRWGAPDSAAGLLGYDDSDERLTMLGFIRIGANVELYYTVPRVISATMITRTTVQLVFSEAMTNDAELIDATNYTITHEAGGVDRTTSSVVRNAENVVTLTLSGPVTPDVVYHVEVNDAGPTSILGKYVSPTANTADFDWIGDEPVVLAAYGIAADQAVVIFSRVMADNAALQDTGSYTIAALGGATARSVDAVTVLGDVMAGDNVGTAVVLTLDGDMSPPAPGVDNYRVTVDSSASGPESVDGYTLDPAADDATFRWEAAGAITFTASAQSPVLVGGVQRSKVRCTPTSPLANNRAPYIEELYEVQYEVSPGVFVEQTVYSATPHVNAGNVDYVDLVLPEQLTAGGYSVKLHLLRYA